MSEKALHNLIIFVLLVAVVLLAIVASKSENFAGGSVPPSIKSGNLSAHLRSVAGIGALSGHLRGGNATISSLSAKIVNKKEGFRGSGLQNMGAAGLKAQIQNGGTKNISTLENFRGAFPGATGLAARLRQSSSDVMRSTAEAYSSDKTGHDNKATNMAIFPQASKMTIMSNLTTK